MIIKGAEVKEKILKGIDLVAETVKPTLGPQAKTVILQGNPPVIINDGVTITKYISDEDPYVNMGIQLVQNLASQAQDESGDGTTTACVLAQALCHKMLDADVKDIHSFNKTLNELKDTVVRNLMNSAKEVKDTDVLDVATIAANNDSELGSLINEAVGMVGRSGIITVEESNSYKTELTLREGLEINEGYLSHLMCNTDGGKVIYENPIIFLSNLSLQAFKDIIPMLEYSTSVGRPLLILCKGMDGSAMNNLLMNIINNTVNCSVILAPNFGDAQLDELLDLKTVLGGYLFASETKDKPTIFVDESFGTCDKVVITKEKTTFIGTPTDKEVVEARIQELAKTLDEVKGHQASRLKSRIARLKGGVATIKVGASSTIEMREKKERLDDALNATKAALEEGIVVGGGLTLIQASNAIPAKHNWFKEALQAPYSTLLENSGRDDLVAIIKDKRVKKDIAKGIAKGNGFNALTNKIENLSKAGVFDPVKVTKSSFLAAMSIAQLFFSTDVAVLLPEE